jgi:hypothetical protein
MEGRTRLVGSELLTGRTVGTQPQPVSDHEAPGRSRLTNRHVLLLEVAEDTVRLYEREKDEEGSGKE